MCLAAVTKADPLAQIDLATCTGRKPLHVVLNCTKGSKVSRARDTRSRPAQ